jgi:quinol monooxygenase YgiN
MTLAQYDQLSPPLLEAIKSAPGFVLHVAYEDSQGLCVAEIWESQQEHDSYFNETVEPAVPAEIQQEVINLHHIVQP